MEDLHACLNNPLKAPAPDPPGKGKRKMEEFASGMEEESVADGRACGICFTEEPRLIRGFIECCDHYFCFLCIMEWAKIESRCPMCKQRFCSIRRPVVPGAFSRERIVRVPARDQAQLHDHDPYADTSCIFCHTSEDEHLLLLCDLCDSSAHTYCSGLGFTIPDGDWYCPDCTISRREQSKMKDFDHHSNDQSVSILEIVGDEGSSKARDLERGKKDCRSLGNEGGVSLVETVARTLHRQRDRHLRIQLLRENWSNFRSGSMDFRSTSVSLTRHRNSVTERVNERIVAPEVRAEHSGSNDIDRAWKMLQLATSANNGQPRASQQPKKSSNNDTMPAGISHRRVLPTNKHLEDRVASVGVAGAGASTDRNVSFGRLRNGPEECGKKEMTAHYGRYPSGTLSSTTSKSAPSGHQRTGNGTSYASSGEAKTEIQSLVKKNLKSRGLHFGKDKFKEVARISTHTILAACGLDHSGPASRPIQAPQCQHGAEARCRPSRLPDSCGDCFLSFVSHVVDVIISERTIKSVDVSLSC